MDTVKFRLLLMLDKFMIGLHGHVTRPGKPAGTGAKLGTWKGLNDAEIQKSTHGQSNI